MAGNTVLEDEPPGGEMGESRVVAQRAQAYREAPQGGAPTYDGSGRRRTQRTDQRLSRMLNMAGASTTTNRAGKMQKTMGKSIFTGAF